MAHLVETGSNSYPCFKAGQSNPVWVISSHKPVQAPRMGPIPTDGNPTNRPNCKNVTYKLHKCHTRRGSTLVTCRLSSRQLRVHEGSLAQVSCLCEFPSWPRPTWFIQCLLPLFSPTRELGQWLAVDLSISSNSYWKKALW